MYADSRQTRERTSLWCSRGSCVLDNDVVSCKTFWRNGRVVEGTCLENKQGESSRGFKSYFLRHISGPCRAFRVAGLFCFVLAFGIGMDAAGCIVPSRPRSIRHIRAALGCLEDGPSSSLGRVHCPYSRSVCRIGRLSPMSCGCVDCGATSHSEAGACAVEESRFAPIGRRRWPRLMGPSLPPVLAVRFLTRMERVRFRGSLSGFSL